MNPIKAIEKLINEHGSAKILKERLALASDKYAKLESDKNTLASEVEKLRKITEDQQIQIKQLEQRLAEKNHDTLEFVKIRGIKILRTGKDSFDENTAYCFHCRSPLSAQNRMSILSCSKCGYKSSIQKRHLSCVLSEVKGEPTPDWWKKY